MDMMTTTTTKSKKGNLNVSGEIKGKKNDNNNNNINNLDVSGEIKKKNIIENNNNKNNILNKNDNNKNSLEVSGDLKKSKKEYLDVGGDLKKSRREYLEVSTNLRKQSTENNDHNNNDNDDDPWRKHTLLGLAKGVSKLSHHTTCLFNFKDTIAVEELYSLQRNRNKEATILEISRRKRSEERIRTQLAVKGSGGHSSSRGDLSTKGKESPIKSTHVQVDQSRRLDDEEKARVSLINPNGLNFAIGKDTDFKKMLELLDTKFRNARTLRVLCDRNI